MNNRINPASFSPQAVSILNSGWLPSSNDPCGFVQYPVNFDNNDEQIVTRVDYQLNANHTVFGRYIDTFERRPAKLADTRNIMTIQAAFLPYRNRRAQTFAAGDTLVLGNNMVNTFRFNFANTQTRANDPPEQFFDAASLGIPNIYSYVPGTMTVAVGATGTDIRFSGNHTVAAKVDSQIYQVSEDFSRVWGRHQLGVGANIQYAYFDGWDYAGSNATFTFNGTVTGLALADFLIGRMSSFGHSSPQINTNHQWYIGVYSQDAWRVSDRVTLNLGFRWDPYMGTVWENGTISNFSHDNYSDGIRSTSFPNAPPGLCTRVTGGFLPARPGRTSSGSICPPAWARPGTSLEPAAQRCGRPTPSPMTFRGARTNNRPRTCRRSTIGSR